MKKIEKKVTIWLFTAVLAACSIIGTDYAKASAAGADVKLQKKSVTLTIKKSKQKTTYGTQKIKIKKAKGVQIKKITCKPKQKNIAAASVKGKSAPTITVKAKKKGSTKITITVLYRKNKKTKSKKLTCSVKVTEKNTDTAPAPTLPPDDGNQKKVPGLYNDKTGKLEVSWDKLITDYFYYDVDVENYVVDPDVDLSGTLVISDTMTEIGYHAFADCAGLTNVVIPDSVTSICSYAFRNCTGLKSISISKYVKEIGIDTFSGCSSLESITVDADNPVYDSRNNCNAIINTGKNSLMFGCQNTVIPGTVTTIQSYAFHNCTGIKSLHIPKSVTSIENRVFSRCSALESITVDSENKVYDSRENCNAIIRTDDNSLMVGCQNTVIPDTVTAICDAAFFHCDTLTKIHIPKSVTQIGYSVFQGCSGLKIMTVDPNNPVYDSREDCNAIIITEENSLYRGCQRTVIPSTVTKIGNSAFSQCDSLKEIVIPENITEIGYSAFYECTGLTNIFIPDSVTKIGTGAFMNCSRLVISIPEHLTNTDKTTFEGIDKIVVRNS